MRVGFKHQLTLLDDGRIDPILCLRPGCRVAPGRTSESGFGIGTGEKPTSKWGATLPTASDPGQCQIDVRAALIARAVPHRACAPLDIRHCAFAVQLCDALIPGIVL